MGIDFKFVMKRKIVACIKKVIFIFPPAKWLKIRIENLQKQLEDLQNQVLSINNKLSKIYNTKIQDICVKNNIHPNDFIFHYIINHTDFSNFTSALDYYFSDGRRSACKLQSLCKEFFNHKPISLLEFASGYGCVTRNLDLEYFDITACDIHKEAMDFISEKFNIKTVLSETIPENIKIYETYDVVFALSFFSHMPDDTFGRWIRTLYEHVKQGGIFIFTVLGRISNEKFMNFFLDDGYAFKPQSEQEDLLTSDYGTTISEYSYVKRICESYIKKIPEIWKEGFWWEHQDLYIVRK